MVWFFQETGGCAVGTRPDGGQPGFPRTPTYSPVPSMSERVGSGTSGRLLVGLRARTRNFVNQLEICRNILEVPYDLLKKSKKILKIRKGLTSGGPQGCQQPFWGS